MVNKIYLNKDIKQKKKILLLDMKCLLFIADNIW